MSGSEHNTIAGQRLDPHVSDSTGSGILGGSNTTSSTTGSSGILGGSSTTTTGSSNTLGRNNALDGTTSTTGTAPTSNLTGTHSTTTDSTSTANEGIGSKLLSYVGLGSGSSATNEESLASDPEGVRNVKEYETEPRDANTGWTEPTLGRDAATLASTAGLGERTHNTGSATGTAPTSFGSGVDATGTESYRPSGSVPATGTSTVGLTDRTVSSGDALDTRSSSTANTLGATSTTPLTDRTSSHGDALDTRSSSTTANTLGDTRSSSTTNPLSSTTSRNDDTSSTTHAPEDTRKLREVAPASGTEERGDAETSSSHGENRDTSKTGHGSDDKVAAKRENPDSIPTAGNEKLGQKHWGESKIVPDNPRPQAEEGVSSAAGQGDKTTADNTAKNAGGHEGQGEGKEKLTDKIKHMVHK